MKKVFLIITTACAILSCNKGATTINVYEETFQFPLLERSDTMGTTVSFRVEYYDSYNGDKVLTEKLNATIRDSVFFGKYTCFAGDGGKYLPESITNGNFETSGKIAAMAFHLNEVWMEGWESAESYYGHGGDYYWTDRDDDEKGEYDAVTWELMTYGEFAGQYKHFQNYLIESSQYTGGAHGNTYIVPIVLNLETGGAVQLTDIVPAENYDALMAIAHDKGVCEYDKDILFTGDEIPDHFSLDESGITFITQPYEWAPWALSFALSWEDLKPVLAPEFK